LALTSKSSFEKRSIIMKVLSVYYTSNSELIRYLAHARFPSSDVNMSSNIEAVRSGFLRWWSVVEVVECGGGVRRRSEEEE
jgi:hypothetical protein